LVEEEVRLEGVSQRLLLGRDQHNLSNSNQDLPLKILELDLLNPNQVLPFLGLPLLARPPLHQHKHQKVVELLRLDLHFPMHSNAGRPFPHTGRA
jgi:hypothetical protein